MHPSVDGRLLVVSNRLPLTLKNDDGAWSAERSSGGLASAMSPILQRTGGIWIGWTGEDAALAEAERDRLLAQSGGNTAPLVDSSRACVRKTPPAPRTKPDAETST